jgi:hypothetical protein
MKHSVWRPLLLVAGVVGLILLARVFIVPKDFVVGERGYRFAWHRLGNEQDWKDFKVKYQGDDYCMSCHPDNYVAIQESSHRDIQCENCHGPGVRMVDGAAKLHPDDIDRLEVDRSPELCLRCHAPLPYASSDRSKIKFMDPAPDGECVACHNPHTAPMEAAR